MPDEENKPKPEDQAQKPVGETGAGESGAGQSEEDKKKAALDAEIAAKEVKKANLDKAIDEAEEILQQKRAEAKAEPEKPTQEAETIPEIDMTDPGAKAWDKRIKDTVDPLAKRHEAERAEIRKFAIREFLNDKPALSRDPQKVAELVEMYERLQTNTGMTKEGVLLDLGRAFAALYHEQLVDAAKTQKFERVKEMQLFSDPGVDQGATGYVNEKPKRPNLTTADRVQLAKWGMTEDDWYNLQQPQAQ